MNNTNVILQYTGSSTYKETYKIHIDTLKKAIIADCQDFNEARLNQHRLELMEGLAVIERETFRHKHPDAFRETFRRIPGDGKKPRTVSTSWTLDKGQVVFEETS